MAKRVSLGIDFGTLSARAVYTDLRDGHEVATAVGEYAHGVMTETLPDGTRIPPEAALQHPEDYLNSISEAVRKATAAGNIQPDEIAGIGIDFTADTSLPVDADNVPLCLKKEFKSEPHAWVKLWKHHSAVQEAEELQAAFEQHDPERLKYYGGHMFSEWMLPKLLETCRKAKPVIDATDRFLQAGDWLVSVLTGTTARSGCLASIKQMYTEAGYPDTNFLASIDPALIRYPELVRGELLQLGERAGVLNERGAELLGLIPGIPVATAVLDAFAPMAGLGITEPGDMMMTIGTSAGQMTLFEQLRDVDGICTVAKDDVIPSWYGYEAGQSAMGDLFAWFTDRIAPSAVAAEAEARQMNIHQVLTEKAAALHPGESGLLALDWWNGCRSPLMDMNLSGVLLGMTLDTKPEEIYRALIEATGFSTRLIVDNYEKAGIPIRNIYACGGISQKNPLLMQIYADILNREFHVAASSQTAALGSAIYGATAAGSENGGYDTVAEAAAAMHCGVTAVYRPDPEAHAVYDRLYREYLRLVDLFGNVSDSMLTRLRTIRMESLK